jgi:predicted RNA-binding Zn-ribbon protein involved in translation (DUF1610 family)
MSEVKIACPACGQEVTVDSADKMKFCPNCGHRLDVQEILSGSSKAPSATPAPAATLNTPYPLDPADEPTQSYASSAAPSQSSQVVYPMTKRRVPVFRILLVFTYLAIWVLIIVFFVLGFKNQDKRMLYGIAFLISGHILLVIGLIMDKAIDKKICYTCPRCGTKRIKHRHWLRTESRFIKGATPEASYVRLTYIYQDYYVCPRDGEVEERIVRVNGGKATNPKNIEEY